MVDRFRLHKILCPFSQDFWGHCQKKLVDHPMNFQGLNSRGEVQFYDVFTMCIIFLDVYKSFI